MASGLTGFIENLLRLGIYEEDNRNEEYNTDDRESKKHEELSSRILRENGIDISEMESDASSHEWYGNREDGRIEEIFLDISMELADIGQSDRWCIGRELDDKDREKELVPDKMIKLLEKS